MSIEKKERLAGDRLKAALHAACDGMVYVSETDSPLHVIFITPGNGSLADEYVFLVHPRSTNTPGGSESAVQFLERLSAYKDWHTEKDKRMVRRYLRLKSLILDNLSQVRLIRRGRVRIEIFLVGRDDVGNIAGFKTAAVET